MRMLPSEGGLLQYWSPPLEFGTNRTGHHAVHSAWSYNLDLWTYDMMHGTNVFRFQCCCGGFGLAQPAPSASEASRSPPR
jgi:hypothetical protein